MLVLSRKEQQSIQIGDDITVIVTAINGRRVSLGIKAPDSCRISRTELQVTDEDDDGRPVVPE